MASVLLLAQSASWTACSKERRLSSGAGVSSVAAETLGSLAKQQRRRRRPTRSVSVCRPPRRKCSS